MSNIQRSNFQAHPFHLVLPNDLATLLDYYLNAICNSGIYNMVIFGFFFFVCFYRVSAVHLHDNSSQVVYLPEIIKLSFISFIIMYLTSVLTYSLYNLSYADWFFELAYVLSSVMGVSIFFWVLAWFNIHSRLLNNILNIIYFILLVACNFTGILIYLLYKCSKNTMVKKIIFFTFRWIAMYSLHILLYNMVNNVLIGHAPWVQFCDSSSIPSISISALFSEYAFVSAGRCFNSGVIRYNYSNPEGNKISFFLHSNGRRVFQDPFGRQHTINDTPLDFSVESGS